MSPPRAMFLATTLTLFAALAAAADAVNPHGYATRDQLRECMALQAALKLRYHGLEQANATNDATGASLEADGAKVHDMQGKLDRGDKAAVAAFRRAVDDYNERVLAWKKQTADAQDADAAYKMDSGVVDQKCVGLAYHPQDIDGVVKERKKAAAAAN